MKKIGPRADLHPRTFSILEAKLQNENISKNVIIGPDPDFPTNYITLAGAAYKACDPEREDGFGYLLRYLNGVKVTGTQLGYLVRHCLYTFITLKEQTWLNKHEKRVISNILAQYTSLEQFCALNTNKSKLLTDMRGLAEDTREWIRDKHPTGPQEAENIMKKVIVFLIAITYIRWHEQPENFLDVICTTLIRMNNPEDGFNDDKVKYTEELEQWMPSM